MIEIDHKPLALECILEDFLKSSEVTTADKKDVVDFILQYFILVNEACKSANILMVEDRKHFKSPNHLKEMMGYESEILIHRFQTQLNEVLDKASFNRASYTKLLLLWPMYLDLPRFILDKLDDIIRVLYGAEDIVPGVQSRLESLNPLILTSGSRIYSNYRIKNTYESNGVSRAFDLFQRILIDTSKLKQLAKKFLDIAIDDIVLHNLVFPFLSYDNELQKNTLSEYTVTEEIYLEGEPLTFIYRGQNVYHRILTMNNVTLYSLPLNASQKFLTMYEFVDTVLTENVSISGTSNFFKNYSEDVLMKSVYKPRIRIVFESILQKFDEIYDRIYEFGKLETPDINTIMQYLNDIHNISYLLRLHDIVRSCASISSTVAIKRIQNLHIVFEKADQNLFNSQAWKSYIVDVSKNVSGKIMLELLHQVSSVRASIYKNLSIYKNPDIETEYNNLMRMYHKAFCNDLKMIKYTNVNIGEAVDRLKREIYLIMHHDRINLENQRVLNMRTNTNIGSLAPAILSCVDTILEKEANGSSNH